MKKLIDLQVHPHLMPIALDVNEDLPKELGYMGHSAYVMFHLSSDGQSLMWFDGAIGTLGDMEVWKQWIADRKVKMALRGIVFNEAMTGGSFALLFDLSRQEMFVGQINRVRNLLMDLIREQAFEDPLGNLLARTNMDLNEIDQASSDDLVNLFAQLRKGVRIPKDKLH